MAGGISDDSNDLAVNHEINVTPFIDVMLVLLIIFMVAAPLSTVDVPVELPVAVAEPAPRPDEPIFVSIKADNSLTIGDEPVSQEEFVWKLELATKLRRDTRIFVRADKSIPYGEFMGLMNKLRLGGFLKVGLVGLEGGIPPPTGGATGAATQQQLPATPSDQ